LPILQKIKNTESLINLAYFLHRRAARYAARWHSKAGNCLHQEIKKRIRER